MVNFTTEGCPNPFLQLILHVFHFLCVYYQNIIKLNILLLVENFLKPTYFCPLVLLWPHSYTFLGTLRSKVCGVALTTSISFTAGVFSRFQHLLYVDDSSTFLAMNIFFSQHSTARESNVANSAGMSNTMIRLQNDQNSVSVSTFN